MAKTWWSAPLNADDIFLLDIAAVLSPVKSYLYILWTVCCYDCESARFLMTIKS